MGQQEYVSNGPAPAAGVPRPDPAVRRWLARTLAADPPRAKSLIVTVWGDALAPHGGGAWLGDLIRLLAPFTVNERLVRIMRDAFGAVWKTAEEHAVSLRTATFIIACTRILQARELRGLYP